MMNPLTMTRTVAALALAACTTAPAAMGSTTCPWQLETVPNPGGELILFGLDGITPGDLWTVGTRIVFVPAGADRFNYAARWESGSWVETPVPQPSTLRNSQNLQDVLSIAPDDAIAVGSHRPASGASQSVAVRWDGANWSSMDAPFVQGGSTFEAIGFGGQDVWAVGSKFSEELPPAASGYPLAARLQDDQWTIHFVPPLAQFGGSSTNPLRAVAGAHENDVWAVGNAQQRDAVLFGPAAMAVHWDGSAWSQVDLFPLLDSIQFSGLEDLAVVAADAVWAVGFDYDNARQQTIPLILHWDGSSWSKSTVPTFDESAELRGVAARAEDDIYAAGTQVDANGFPHALILHFDGSSWSEVPQSVITDYGTWFRGIDFVGDDLWVSGQANDLTDGITQRREPCDPACTADFNADGAVNFFDVADFIDAFNAQDPTTDLDANGQSNFFDVAAFIDTFNAGCP